MSETKTEKLVLPDDVTLSTQTDARDLVIISIPKMGKGTILGRFTEENNAIVFDLEKGGYEYINARKLSIYESNETSAIKAYENYMKYRKALFDAKGKYTYLIIDGLSDLDLLSEIGGTLMYMNSIIGKKFNRANDGTTLQYGHPDFKSVLTLPDGAGYAHTRKWFLDQIEIFRQISPFRIYAAHVADKYIKDTNREEVIGSELSLTGKLKTIFASKVTALAKLMAEGDKRFLNFDVVNDSIIAGSRNPKLHGKILISEKLKDGTIATYWKSIYNQ